jgi:hypothetical protein
MMSKNNHKNISFNFNINGTQYGNNYAADQMYFGQNKEEKIALLLNCLDELNKLIQKPSFPFQVRRELLPLIHNAQQNLNTGKPKRSFIDKLLKVANKYNSFTGLGQLIISISSLVNDIFNS